MTTAGNPKTILFLNHTAKVSGAERVLLLLLRNLDRTSFVPYIGCPEGNLADACAEMSIPRIAMPEMKARFTSNPLLLLRYIGSSIGNAGSFRKSLKTLRPDLIHANTVRSGLVAAIAAFGLGIPLVWHLHDQLPRSTFGKLIRLFAYLLPSISAIAVSHASEASLRLPRAEHLIRRFPITVIHNSVDTERFYPDPEARQRVRAELGLADHDVAVGIVAQLTRRKRQLQLVQGFSALTSHMPHVRLIVVGSALFTADDRAYAEELQNFVLRNGLDEQVRLLGERRDMPALLCGMDIVAQNSAAEPFGLALAEGLASEVPAVAPARDGFLEVVHDGVTGLLSNPDEVHALIGNIRRLAEDAPLRRQMGTRGRIEMIERFPESRQIAAMHHFYCDLLYNQHCPAHSHPVTPPIPAGESHD